MEEGDVHCFNCEAPCSNALGNYAPCDLCSINPLCVACSTSFDIAVCRLCAEQQGMADKEKELARSGMNPCVTCSKVWNTQKCNVCDKYWCYDCFRRKGTHLNGLTHTCYACYRCGTYTERRCCGYRWCEDCFDEYHVKTNCRVTLSYLCPTCKDTVLQFGSDTFRCAIPDCRWKYACQHGDCGAKIRSKEGLAFCQYHCSKEICQGCGSRYGLNGLQGPVRILQLLGHGSPRQIYCGNCRQRCRAFIQGILIANKQQWGLKIPKVVMDMLLFAFMKRKWLEWRLTDPDVVWRMGLPKTKPIMSWSFRKE